MWQWVLWCCFRSVNGFFRNGEKQEDNVHSGKSLKQLVKEYGLSSNLFRLRVVGDSAAWKDDYRVGYPAQVWIEYTGGASWGYVTTPLPENNYSEAGRSRYGSSERGYSVCDGDFEKIKLFAEDYLLEMLDEHTTEEAKNSANSLDFMT